ncbi:group-specific protein [Alkalihalobacillus alcalophilus ATCC 27647 = CGMCC 1.3604]|uniref:Group-specific protein n=1 Tax=Alkalihalobacillus alcalophilus ATCC 27647 = CGMCC 1.3604 TaxID=1218173 RepID=A0A094WKV8_ALKAL|nr:alpha/beta hydrolase [Alkalihalobacillus alcalophilus]KGA98379.1 group-specific protein [Alkalihalobacillus alcalophilus ATCC 27647 = CGMCC 1.3604]MED1563678.1 alpha/beta hydrolase [Alkalihalobacillus alcalophilus]
MSNVEFIKLQKEMFTLFATKNFEEIHRYIDKVQTSFPTRLDKTLFWTACAYSLQQKTDEAISTFYQGLEKEIWWNPNLLTNDPDLHNLQDEKKFQELLTKCEDIYETEKLAATAKWNTYGNPESNTGIFTLHWRGSSNQDFAPYWLDEKTENYHFGFLQSSQIFSYNSYSWDNHVTSLNDITYFYEKFDQEYKHPNQVFAGASHGGHLAIELVLKQTFPKVNKFIAVIPAIKDVDYFETLIKSTLPTNIKGYIITGDEDPFYQNTLQLITLFEAYQIDCQFIVKQGLGHFFPDDFTSLLSIALKQLA